MARTPHPDLVHFALAVGGFAIGTTEFASMSLLPYFARDLGISAPTAGHVISAYALGVVLGAPLIAVLAARLARRTLLIGLMLVFALANGLTGLSPSYPVMLIFRFLSGLPHGAYFGVAMLVAASLVPARTPGAGRGAGADGPDRGHHHRRALRQLAGPGDRLALGLCHRGGAGAADRDPGGAVRAASAAGEGRQSADRACARWATAMCC